MSITITLFQNSKLSNKYHECFVDQSSAVGYLFGLTYLQVYYGDDIYYTNSGTLSLDNTDLTSFTADKYNYMLIRDGNISDHKYRFCFVDSIQLVNSIAIINYSEDIWHNYAIKWSSGWNPDGTPNLCNFDICHSMLYQTKTLQAYTGSTYDQATLNLLPKARPIDLEGQNNPSFYTETATPYDEYCYILVSASVYKLAGSGDVNWRETKNYLLSYNRHSVPSGDDTISPLHASGYLWNIDNQTLEILNYLKASTSDHQVFYQSSENVHFELLNVKLIPQTIGDVLFNGKLSSDTTHDNGLYPEFKCDWFYSYDYISPSNPNNMTYQFPTDIYFNNICVNKANESLVNGVIHRYWNGFEANERPTYTQTIDYGEYVIAIGNQSRIIPITFNGQEKKFKIELVINQYGNSLNLFIDNTITDVSDDFTLIIPFEVDSADITQQRKIALKTGNSVAMIGMIGTAVQTGLSMGASFVGGMKGISGATTSAQLDYAGSQAGINIASSGSSGILSLISSAIQLDAKNRAQYISNKAINSSESAVVNAILGGYRELQMNYDNIAIYSYITSTYGYLYQIELDSIAYVYYSNNFIKFMQANVHGNFSQDIARNIETMLENGLILISS